jgi:hypothetical protein
VVGKTFEFQDASEKKLSKAGRAARTLLGGGAAPPSTPQGTSGIKQQKKRAGPSASPQEAGPLHTSLYELLEIWEREAAPAKSILQLATIRALHAFGSEGVALD